ncbi:hypothetical protein EOD23_20010 [Mesorhizobium sp. USDA-HM6]|nr:hypothetical protein EOD23_20010 [Mesorhizobium sp. USDA-HM6]
MTLVTSLKLLDSSVITKGASSGDNGDSMPDINLPNLKEILWENNRSDLVKYVPKCPDDLILCPTCCRFLKYDDFSIEHIVPQQALDDDDASVKKNLTKSDRSVVTLLCNKQLLINGKRIYANGCNSWKGRFYDKFLRDIFNAKIVNSKQATTRHQIALLMAAFIAMFERFGYQVALTPSAAVMRHQFFNPDRFIRGVPLKSQMILLGSPQGEFKEDIKSYWVPPFKFSFDPGFCAVVARNAVLYVPVSRNPEIPLAQVLPFAPSKYKFRPDFKTFFD